ALRQGLSRTSFANRTARTQIAADRESTVLADAKELLRPSSLKTAVPFRHPKKSPHQGMPDLEMALDDMLASFERRIRCGLPAALARLCSSETICFGGVNGYLTRVFEETREVGRFAVLQTISRRSEGFDLLGSPLGEI